MKGVQKEDKPENGESKTCHLADISKPKTMTMDVRTKTNVVGIKTLNRNAFAKRTVPICETHSF